MIRFLIPILMLPLVAGAAEKVPPASIPLMPVLTSAIDYYWADMPMRSFFGGQIEQETCISMTHKKCWSPTAELKTSRENGVGLGQLTVAYNADGSVRFNAFEETKALNKDLQGWKWEDRYRVDMQIKALVIKNKFNWSRIKFPVADDNNKMAFLSVAYNAGMPITDIRLCKTIPGCKPDHWWGNVELHSTKQKTAVAGYGKSFFEISREYPRNILNVRRHKYVPYLEGTGNSERKGNE